MEENGWFSTTLTNVMGEQGGEEVEGAWFEVALQTTLTTPLTTEQSNDDNSTKIKITKTIMPTGVVTITPIINKEPNNDNDEDDDNRNDIDNTDIPMTTIQQRKITSTIMPAGAVMTVPITESSNDDDEGDKQERHR